MGILDEDVAAVRAATDLVALASEHLAVRRAGNRFVGLCPFHSEKSPSFSINPALGVYYCFGCQASGDAISFVREVEHLDFVGAVERLAARANITIRRDEASSEIHKKRLRLTAVMTAAVDFAHQRLLEDGEAGGARKYLRSRGFDGDVARAFKIGFAGEGFDAMSTALQRAGFKRGDLLDAGLSFVNKANRLQDQFRGRLLFPIFDARGDAIGFGGRRLDDGFGPKYKNSPDGVLYHKSRVLYGLHLAKSAIVNTDRIVLCEGYTDVIAFHVAGVQTAVATCGTALADEHFQIIKNLTRHIVLAYDGDAAGAAAAEKCAAWEARYEVQFSVAQFPSGSDPADLFAKDPAALAASVDSAQPFMKFRLSRLLDGRVAGTIEDRARLAEEAASIVASHPSELVRDEYAVYVADQLDLDADAMRRAVATAKLRPNQPASDREITAIVAARKQQAAVLDPRERAVLLLSVQRPDLVVNALDGALFLSEDALAAYESLMSSETLELAIGSSDERTAELLRRLAVEELPAENVDLFAAEAIASLVAGAASAMRRVLVRDGDSRAIECSQLLDQLRTARQADDWQAVRACSLRLLGFVTWEATSPNQSEEMTSDTMQLS